MSKYETETQEPDEQQSNIQKVTFSFPVPVPEEIEASARDRMKTVENAPEDVEYAPDYDQYTEREVLAEYLLDHYQFDPQYLTRDVVHDGIDEPLTDAVFAPVTSDQREQIEAFVRASDRFNTVQEYVREQVLEPTR